MSRKRRILILTEAQHAMIVQAMGYVRDTHDTGDGDGDVSNQWAAGNERVLRLVSAAPKCDPSADMQALADIFDVTVTSSCNCLRGAEAGKRKNGTHASDCVITTHRAAFNRIEALRYLFNGAMFP